MSLIDRLARLPSAPSSPGLPERLVKAAERIRQRFGDRRPVKPDALDVLVDRLTQAIRQWDWSRLTEGEIAQVVRAWASRLVRVAADVEDFLLRELGRSTRRSLLGALCDGYFIGWVTQNARTAELAHIIQDRAAWLPKSWQIVFRATPESLDTNEGAVRLGRWLAVQSAPYRAVIERGIVTPHGPGFMSEVHGAWLAALPEPRDETTIRRMLAWIHPPGVPKLEGDRATAVVARLLRPWANTMPPKPLRTLLLDELIRNRGDPRRENEHFWAQVGEDGKRTMLRWLAGQRMEAFLDVVSRSEEKLEAGDQWPARRRFWMGLYEEGRIDEAWPSYGTDAQAIADQLARTTGDLTYSAYGRQLSRKNTSLLIMRVGPHIVVEGSHNFRVHVFHHRENMPLALYQLRYDVDNFMLPDPHPDARRHVGNWMNWVREKIR
ncbi:MULTISPECIES: EH signature domain-containing protein [Kaistia]|uniref:EH signature domain-containing protein n=1 Tax=Kaistia nematophila TaxID=2994654 RepID=A0A9X3DYF8_9HYPH|nr:EH signature domain-containing protein [Kaistia nematophila]MCX5568170.1 EH signature domain-containing protein [Kaistia nematophila]